MLLKLIKKTKTLFKISYWLLIDKLWFFVPTKKTGSASNNNYSIGIVTYINRYDKLFKPLIRNLCKIFPNTEIIVIINGYYDADKQKKYLETAGKFLSNYPNIKKITYQKGESLSKLWNQVIINASNEKVIICNDDVKINPAFRKTVEQSGALSKDIVLLNNSWSHFVISKSIIATNGWFDERLPGVGNEDEDYETRLVFNNIFIESVSIKGLKNIIFHTRDFSYSKNTEIINQKYVKENKLFFDKKWEMSEEKKDGYLFVRLLGKYLKLRNGMETPDFYPEIRYEKLKKQVK